MLIDGFETPVGHTGVFLLRPKIGLTLPAAFHYCYKKCVTLFILGFLQGEMLDDKAVTGFFLVKSAVNISPKRAISVMLLSIVSRTE